MELLSGDGRSATDAEEREHGVAAARLPACNGGKGVGGAAGIDLHGGEVRPTDHAVRVLRGGTEQQSLDLALVVVRRSHCKSSTQPAVAIDLRDRHRLLGGLALVTAQRHGRGDEELHQAFTRVDVGAIERDGLLIGLADTCGESQLGLRVAEARPMAGDVTDPEKCGATARVGLDRRVKVRCGAVPLRGHHAHAAGGEVSRG